MTKTILSMALWSLCAWLVGAWINPATGWGLLAFGLAIMILVSGVQLSRISRWVKNIDAPPPPSVGPWDDVLAAVYRKLRKNREETDRLTGLVHSITLAAEALPDGAITLNDEMQVTWCNKVASDHIGLNLDTDRGFSIFNILRSPEFARYGRQSAWPRPLVLHLVKDGREKKLQVQLTPYGIRQFLLVTRDVTQFEKLETTRRDFVANVSHELRTPLTVLLGFVETLHDLPQESLPPDQQKHYLALMKEQASRMQAIVEDLLTLSALESTPNAPGEPTQTPRLIHNALLQARLLSAGRHHFIENIDPRLHIRGNETELNSAIGNLLTNAVRYTPEGETITITWQTTKNGTARYTVQDTGIGIAAQDIPRLTERFYRVDRGRSRACGGTGLGLAIAKHVAHRHQAELHIQSRLGAGSTFTLEFPPSRIVPPDQAAPSQTSGSFPEPAQEPRPAPAQESSLKPVQEPFSQSTQEATPVHPSK